MALNSPWAAATIVIGLFLAIPIARSQSADAALEPATGPFPTPQQTASPNTSSPPVTAGSGDQTSPAQSTTAVDEERTKSQVQLQQEEHQRVLGVMATFNTTRNKDALPLTPRQKYQLFFKSATDPWPFAVAAFGAGIDQADNSFPEYGQGMQGYAKRFGAAYTDYFTGNFFGNAVLTSILHEDPRYFQKGTGSFASRALWASGSTVWCRRDKGTWGPNYANVIGNLMGSAISNLYYPAADRTARGTIERGITVSAEGIIGAEVIEFWPDIVRHYRRKQAEKLARQSGQSSPQPASQSGSTPTH